ncbi:triose-phosphate isomerase [Endozoicomonas atrinae]|uniref:triose-phosphate isomerase n=1 Tax=Endozoicomonas atrinae TaxID=1333660 RepID=UPI000824F2A0|nr:triose-phosphate isomerase [Endozoicomonas atrinae]
MGKKEILVNLKRFEVSRSQGGVCDVDQPGEWLQSVIAEIIRLELDHSEHYNMTVIVPDLLLPFAVEELSKPSVDVALKIGTQSCHREDVALGGHFGAFTSLNIASSQANMGSSASLLGHCEERRELSYSMQKYAEVSGIPVQPELINRAVSEIVGERAVPALAQSMRVIICVGESAEERGEGTFTEQKLRIEQVIRDKLVGGLSHIREQVTSDQLVIAYEPVWAIGPGKTPPDQQYIEYIAGFIKSVTMELLGFEASVVYGGGLKNENASMLAGIENLDGGLIALTNFTPPIGFNVKELSRILTSYTEALN